MTDNFIQHQPDSTGKKIETEERVNYDGVTVHRQTTAVVGDVAVSGTALEMVLLEFQVISVLLGLGLGIDVNIDALRSGLAAERIE